VRAIGQALLDRGLSQDRPLAILSDNDIEHALLALACMHVGIAYVPVSSAYSLLSADYAKLKQVLALLTPGLVYATDGARFAKAIAAAVPAGTEVVTGSEFVSWKKPRTAAGWTRRMPPSVPTRSRNSCSPPARPGSRRR
jgi:acyl-CoA synthetase (AMP-forming)/AMP-acid ligase II